VVVLLAVAGAVALYRFKHHASIMSHLGAVAVVDTLTVNKGTKKYRVEPGNDYVPINETARWARVESLGGNWFVIGPSIAIVRRSPSISP
jgi:hypothetical protein